MNSQLFTDQDVSDLSKTQFSFYSAQDSALSKNQNKEDVFYWKFEISKNFYKSETYLIVSLHIFNEKTIPYFFAIVLVDQNLLVKNQTKTNTNVGFNESKDEKLFFVKTCGENILTV